jgi:hypothetical protein
MTCEFRTIRADFSDGSFIQRRTTVTRIKFAWMVSGKKNIGDESETKVGGFAWDRSAAERMAQGIARTFKAEISTEIVEVTDVTQ